MVIDNDRHANMDEFLKNLVRYKTMKTQTIKVGYNPKLVVHGEVLRNPSNDRPLAFLGSLRETALMNESYRKIIYTSRFTQLVVMNLKPYETIDREIHEYIDQVFEVVQGSMSIAIENPQETLPMMTDDHAEVPSGTYHTITAGSRGVKIITIYTGMMEYSHPYDRIQNNKPIGGDDEEE